MLSPAPDLVGLAAKGYDSALVRLVLEARRPGVVPRRPPDGAAMAPAARPATDATAARWRHRAGSHWSCQTLNLRKVDGRRDCDDDDDNAAEAKNEHG